MSIKDNYPLPKMDHILQRVVGSSRISLLDGFSGYNQILVQPEDQAKTTFTTPWGTFMYLKMPFGLMNARATFQRAMDIAFSKEIHGLFYSFIHRLELFPTLMFHLALRLKFWNITVLPSKIFACPQIGRAHV